MYCKKASSRVTWHTLRIDFLKDCGLKLIKNINGRFNSAYLADTSFKGEKISFSSENLKAKKYKAANQKKQNRIIVYLLDIFTP